LLLSQQLRCVVDLLRTLLPFRALLPLRRFHEGRGRPRECPTCHQHWFTRHGVASVPQDEFRLAPTEIILPRHSAPTSERHPVLLPNRHPLLAATADLAEWYILLDQSRRRSKSHQPHLSQFFAPMGRRSHFDCVSLKQWPVNGMCS